MASNGFINMCYVHIYLTLSSLSSKFPVNNTEYTSGAEDVLELIPVIGNFLSINAVVDIMISKLHRF